ncbi:hypothetical protein Taro_032373, partial [Colocasia esculenta]|nr:hypothetical protein [Colocasia esculenta]
MHVHQAAELKQTDPELVQLEIGLVDIFVNLCRFEWQSGFRELATGLFQAEIEYSLFCPSLLLSSQNKQRLFEHFWNGDGARVGEDGAVGWSGWLELEEENRQHIMEDDVEEEVEVGGWSGWFEPSSRTEDVTRKPENLAEDAGEDGQKDEDLEMEEYHEEEDVEALLRKLGIDVDAEPQTEVKDSATWNRWAKEEISRDFAQWMPVREKSESIHSGDLGRESNERLSRVILYEDVSDYIFSLSSEEARFRLVSQFIDFFGGKISQWLKSLKLCWITRVPDMTCTNSASWTENTLGLEEVPDSFIENLKDDFQMATQVNCDSSHQSLKFLLGSKTYVSRKAHIMKFLCNAILLCMQKFPRNYILEEALLVAEELCFTQMRSSVGSVTHSRALAKSLLKNDRQDLLLCGVYARREAAYGNIDLARKVFDMALLSINGLPPDLQGNAPLLYFWYADMEMSASLCRGDEISSQRSSYIVSCLGSNTKYEPFKSQASGLQLLRARQGFKEQINRLRPSWARGDIREGSIALICSASLLEILTTGWAAGLEIIEEAFSMGENEEGKREIYSDGLPILTVDLDFITMRLLDRQDDHCQSIVFASWSPSPFDCDGTFERSCQ